jgi:hypothetical protein
MRASAADENGSMDPLKLQEGQHLPLDRLAGEACQPTSAGACQERCLSASVAWPTMLALVTVAGEDPIERATCRPGVTLKRPLAPEPLHPRLRREASHGIEQK